MNSVASHTTAKLGTAGIVTMADANYFPGLQLLNRSTSGDSSLPICCFDGGLTGAQLHEIDRLMPNVLVLPIPQTPAIHRIKERFASSAPLAKKNKRVWPLWICPHLIQSAPFQRVFWLDCDIAVLRRLPELFAKLDGGPVFTLENNAPQASLNKPQLYERLPIRRAFDPARPVVNGGVSGWDLIRDREVLKAYKLPIERAIDDADISDAISWWDQGALIWAIQSLGLEHRVLQDRNWNLCVKHTPLARNPIPYDSEFLPRLRNMLPDVNLLHWNGYPVPWPT